jgi:DNA-binding response OmpR family regulator
MAGERILIIEDDKEINNLIRSYLLKEGFIPFSAFTGQEARNLIAQEKPDLILLDFMLPDTEGPELCLELRKQSDVPVLFVSCRAEEIDKIVSLSAGGDDYITKPFLPGELIARIKANLRRSRKTKEEQADAGSVISAGGLTINVQLREVRLKNREINLTAREFDILELLAKNPKRIFTADQLFKIVWKTTSLGNDPKTVAVHISALRKKIEPEKDDDKFIISVRGVGYKFNHQLLEQSGKKQ